MFGYRSLGFGAFPNRDVTFSVGNSALFNDGDSDHLTQASTRLGNQFAWTLAFWFKLGVIDGRKMFFGQDDSYVSINENSSTSHKINIYNVGRGAASGSNATGWYWETAALFRDPHAWYHLVVAFDSLQADAATFSADNALRVYANGVELTEFSPKHSSGTQYNGLATNAGFHDFGSAETMFIGRNPQSAGQYWDGYLAQMVYINGRQLTPTSFGEFDTAGRWKPKDLTDTLTASTTAEAIVNVASSVSTSDATSYTFSSVALGTASSTRAAYVFISGQESTGTAGTITATINTGGGAVAMTKIIDVNNTTEAHYQGSLFRADISSGTSADIVASITRTMSQLGAIVWTVTGDHHVFDLKVDTDTSSSTTTTVSLTDVPANSVILAGRASAGSQLHTWSSNLTENIDEVVEGTVRHTGASTATASGGDFTITCVPDSSGSDARGRMFALVLSPTEGAGRNGFYLPFTESGVLGADLAETGRTAPSVSFLQSAASTSNAQNYTFSSQSLGTAADDRKIIACVNSSAVNVSALSVSSVTIGGVSATQIVAGNADNNNSLQPFAIFIADVPSGTSGDVVVSLNANNGANCHIALYRATGAGETLSMGTINNAATSSTTTLTRIAQMPENSVAILHGNKNGKDVAMNLTGVTEEYDFGHDADSGADMRTFGGINTSAASSGAVALTTSAALASGTSSYLGITTIVIKPVGDNSFTVE